MPKRAMLYSAEYVRDHIQARITVEDRGHATACWIWQSGITGAGYATGHPAGCKPGLMHRMSYEASVAPIPKGLVIDHLCRVTRCVNPEHLEPVTQHENMRRSVGNWQHRADKELAAARETKRGEGCSEQRPDSEQSHQASHIAHDERATRL